jgi:hypothetical protein
MIPTTPIPTEIVPTIIKNRLFNLPDAKDIQPLYPLKNTGSPSSERVDPVLTGILVMLFWDFAKFYAQSFGDTLAIGPVGLPRGVDE